MTQGMSYQQFNDFCQAMKSSLYVMHWGGSHVWKVGDETQAKVFAIGGWSKDDRPAISFKVSEHHYEILKDQDGFRPAPYMASRGMKWIQWYEGEHIPNDQIHYYLEESYRLVSLNLTTKK